MERGESKGAKECTLLFGECLWDRGFEMGLKFREANTNIIRPASASCFLVDLMIVRPWSLVAGWESTQLLKLPLSDSSNKKGKKKNHVVLQTFTIRTPGEQVGGDDESILRESRVSNIVEAVLAIGRSPEIMTLLLLAKAGFPSKMVREISIPPGEHRKLGPIGDILGLIEGHVSFLRSLVIQQHDLAHAKEAPGVGCAYRELEKSVDEVMRRGRDCKGCYVTLW
ncbi:hypothetical protein OIU85_015977 [Salix viminalis]|uniref:Uncharacterized protein n=1 Tax=Salix viminalis TaxID=40686 RepID=A0A9Q0V477_SALVM|nr:hypothetical protein OIU85_015977 [Salix viminalis]